MTEDTVYRAYQNASVVYIGLLERNAPRYLRPIPVKHPKMAFRPTSLLIIKLLNGYPSLGYLRSQRPYPTSQVSSCWDQRHG